MKVFISWSGVLSREFGTVLREWLPCAIQGVEVFMSQHDIESGTRWSMELAKQLEATSFGIMCLTPENLKSEWLLFEAGALTKHLEGRVCGLLLKNLSPTDVKPPLGQFQHREFSPDGIKALLRDINSRTQNPLTPVQVDRVFEKWWPDLAKEYQRLLSEFGPAAPQVQRRSERELLEEILLKVRDLDTSAFSRLPAEATARGDVVSRSLSYDALAWYTLWKFPGLPISDVWQRQLLSDINRERYPTIREIDAAVEKAAPAVKKYSKKAPQLFRHGTDFITKSLGFVDEEFRKKHPWGETTLSALREFATFVRKSAKNGNAHGRAIPAE
ncbi:MAG: toll/interleukin-1 receptor domain-containing protein [Verrucomicrobia bacterium]|nr:toll/interleukin-1 receptor domain-containing protein [Verrucomicrobiota bacterium]